jgi:ligand-binding sensor domain-containing protein
VTAGRLAAAILTVLAPAARLGAQRWLPEERVLVTEFSFVTAVAASPYTVYAATPRGLLIYDRAARVWQPPVTWLDGYPRMRAWVALADAVNDAVWFGTPEGWARYDPRLRTWERGAVAGGVRALAFDARDLASGIFVRGAAGWAFLPRGAFATVPGTPPPAAQRIESLDPRAALERAPMADALRAVILSDARLRQHQFTSASATPDRSDIFFGTTGMGLVRVDGTTGEWEALSFGLPAPGAGAVAAGANGVWVAVIARPGERAGLAWVPADASAVRVIARPGAVGTPFLEGRRLLARDRTVWVATERGVWRVDASSGDVGSSRSAALADEDVRALAPARGGVWVGTARGLALVGDDGTVARLGSFAAPVLSLALARDTLWIGSAAGLGALAPGADAPVVPPAVAATAALRDPIVALARSADTLVAATPDQLAWRDPAGGAWTVIRPRADLGRLTALAGDEGGVWVGGTLGLAFWHIGRGTFHALRVPLDLPAAVRDVAVTLPWLWVATDSGLVRFDRRAALR